MEKEITYYKGQVVYSTWGYGQTNQSFYKVTKVSKSGKTITIRELETTYKASKENYMDGYEKPLASLKYKKDGKLIKKRVSNHIRVEKYMGGLKVWDGEPKVSTWWN